MFVLGSEQVISERVVRRLEGAAPGRGSRARRTAPRASPARSSGSRAPRPSRTRSPSRATRRATSAGGGRARLQLRARQRVAAARRPGGRRARDARRVRPLLLTDDAVRLPKPLEEYFLSVQPGYEDDPGEAVYNRAWVLGDEDAVSVEAGPARCDSRADPGSGERPVGSGPHVSTNAQTAPRASPPSRTCAS